MIFKLLVVLGNGFKLGRELCGVGISIKADTDMITVWNRSTKNTRARNRLISVLTGLFSVPKGEESVICEYRAHEVNLMMSHFDSGSSTNAASSKATAARFGGRKSTADRFGGGGGSASGGNDPADRFS
jgi:hypothetical protein